MIDTSAFNWQDDAACRGLPMVLFFGPEGEEKPARLKREKQAKRICGGCPKRERCLEFGLSQRGGVFGGKNDDERAVERRRRARRAAKASAGVA